MLRLLIRDITVVKGAEPKLLHLQIRWQGGATETIDVHRQPTVPKQCVNPTPSLLKSGRWRKNTTMKRSLNGSMVKA
jgi:hypothetical protein